MSSVLVLRFAVAGAGLAFVSYCFYFDRKRRSDPQFRQNLIAKRRKMKQASKECTKAFPEVPMQINLEAAQRFYVQEIQLAEERLHAGDAEKCIGHLVNVIGISAHPEQLILALQKYLPQQYFQILFIKLLTGDTSLPTGVGTAAVPGKQSNLEEPE